MPNLKKAAAQGKNQVNPFGTANGFQAFKIQKKVKGYSDKHPFNNEENHRKLITHIAQRMDLAKQMRDELVIRLRNIDMDLAAFVKLDDDDKQRMLDNRRGKSAQVVDVQLPLSAAKVDELVTFLLEVIWPNSQGMFSAESTADKQDLAKALAARCNRDAKFKDYYSKIARFLLDAIKYNISAIGVEWCVNKGIKITNGDTKNLVLKKDEVIFEGNDIFNIDMYNFFWDPTYTPVEAVTKGEFVAHVKMYSKFSVQKMAAAGDLVGVDRWIDTAGGTTGSRYYQEKPIVRFDYNANTGSVDWIKFASGDMYSTIGAGCEMIYMYCWINPSDFGLSDDEELQIWRFVAANGIYLAAAEHMDNAHQLLPLVVTVPYDDGLGLQHKSAAETTLDSQRFASFLMNVHQQACRKLLWGLQVYDPNAVDLKQLGKDTSGRVPIKPGYNVDKSMDQIVKTFNEAPPTEHTMEMIKEVIDLMEVIMPTNIQKNITDLDRATTYQAAATVQATNRRSLKNAKIIDDQAISKVRMMIIWNILQYAQSIDAVGQIDPQTQQPAQISVAELRDKGFEFDIGEGIQGIDRLMVVHLLHDIINALLQSQEAQKTIDMVGLINYWSQLFGLKIDLTQFKLQPQTAPSPTEQQDMHNDKVGNVAQLAQVAAQLKQAGGGQGQ